MKSDEPIVLSTSNWPKHVDVCVCDAWLAEGGVVVDWLEAWMQKQGRSVHGFQSMAAKPVCDHRFDCSHWRFIP